MSQSIDLNDNYHKYSIIINACSDIFLEIFKGISDSFVMRNIREVIGKMARTAKKMQYWNGILLRWNKDNFEPGFNGCNGI